MEPSIDELSHSVPPARTGRHSWWRYLLTVLLAFGVQTGVLIVAAIGLIQAGFPSDRLLASAQDPGQPFLYFSTVGLSFGGLLLGFVMGGYWLHKRSFSDYLGAWKVTDFAFGCGVWFAVLVVDVGLSYLVRPEAFRLSPSGLVPAVTAITCLGLAVQTFTEEFIFRGYLNQALQRILRRPLPTAIVSGLVFGLAHIPNGWPQAVSATLLGIGLSLIAMRTGSLAVGYGLHLVNNLFGALIVVSGGDVFRGSPGLLIETAPDLVTLDVAVVAVAIPIVTAIVYRRTRPGPVSS
jgi:membrane protease YdiL (CAAX protease family)